MAKWRIEGKPHRYPGGADRSATVAYGFKFTLVHTTESRKREVNVELADFAQRGLSEQRARGFVAEHLDDVEPPSRILVDADDQPHPE